MSTRGPSIVLALFAWGACRDSRPPARARPAELEPAAESTPSSFGQRGYGIFGPGRSHHGSLAEVHAVDPMPGLWVEGQATPNQLLGAARVGPYAVGAFATEDLDRDVAKRDSGTYLPTFVFAHATISESDRPTSPVHTGFPWELLARHEPRVTRAEIWLDPARAWVDASIDLDLARTSDAIFLEAALGTELTVVSVSWRGRPVPWRMLFTWIVIDGGAAGDGTLHLHLRGRPREERDHITKDSASLRALVPVIPDRDTTFDVTLHVPEHHRVDTALESSDAPSVAGWRAVRVTGRSTHLVATIRPESPTSGHVVEHGGVRWQVPAGLDVGDLPAMVDAFAPLGAPPSTNADLRLIVPIASEADAKRDAHHAVASAIATWWLGGKADTTHEMCPWRDAAAMQLGTWAMLADDAARVRRTWTEAAGAAQPFRLVSNGPQLVVVRRELCARGALILADLERRLGRPKLAAILRDAHAHGASGWAALAAEVTAQAGDDAVATWFRVWIERPRSPAFGLCNVTRETATIRGTLQPLLGQTQETPWPDGTPRYFSEPLVDRIAVAAMDRDREIARIELDAGTQPVAFTIPNAAGATSVVVDPDGRVPLRVGELPNAIALPASGAAASRACPSPVR